MYEDYKIPLKWPLSQWQFSKAKDFVFFTIFKWI